MSKGAQNLLHNFRKQTGEPNGVSTEWHTQIVTVPENYFKFSMLSFVHNKSTFFATYLFHVMLFKITSL